MGKHLERMKIEKQELGTRLKRLNDFIDEQVSLPYEMRKNRSSTI